MTRTVTVVLLGFIVVLSVFTAGVLFVMVPSSSDTSFAPVSVDAGGIKEESEESALSHFLSVLSLFPGSQRSVPLIAVMVENQETARLYHTGLADALLIQEFMVEGQISRFAAVYDFRMLPPLIGPVRSLRPYFIDGLVPLVRTILYAGGSPEAFERIQNDPSFMAYNGLAHDTQFVRDNDIPAPHNLFLDTSALDELVTVPPTPTEWPPYEIGSLHGGSGATVVDLNYYSTSHNVTYTYDPLLATYSRINGGIESDLHPANVLVLEMPILGIGEHGRLTIDVIGEGDAMLFRSGRLQRGRWNKSVDSPFTFETSDGEPLLFARGATWMTMLPSLDRVEWSE